ncbi:hypothetical protein [Streptomyces sp. NPDC088812]|uniref:hypothetical protein n=1 Tax=Streptomyces sp. NPDC088812 TaxID=3365905 RepID=UPI00382A376B
MPENSMRIRCAVGAATVAAVLATTAAGPALSATRESVRPAHTTTCSVGGPKSGARATVSWTNRSATVNLTVWDDGTWLRPTKAFVQAYAGSTYVGGRDLTADEGQAHGSFLFTTSRTGGVTSVKLWTESGASESVVRACTR